MRHAWAARRYYRIRVASGPAVGARHKEGTGARLQRELIQREDSEAGWECQCRCQCRNGLIRRREHSEGHRYGLILPKGLEGHRKGLGGHHHRGWEALDRDEEGLDRAPRGEGVRGRVLEGTVRDRRGGEVQDQDQDQEGLDHLDGPAQGGWGAPRHRAMPAGVQVGMEAVVDMEGTDGRETGRLK